jgi:hypothetical protein
MSDDILSTSDVLVETSPATRRQVKERGKWEWR